MPTVYRTGTNPSRRRFHRTPDCYQLVKKPAKGEKAEVEEVDLASLDKVIPCRSCYTDAPHVPVSRRYCYICDPGAVRPCAHNGGVPVFIKLTHRKQTLFSEVGDTYVRRDFVWPEYAHLHI